MNTNTLAAGVVGFLLGGLTVSIAAELEDDAPAAPAHGAGTHQTVPGTGSGRAAPRPPEDPGARRDLAGVLPASDRDQWLAR